MNTFGETDALSYGENLKRISKINYSNTFKRLLDILISIVLLLLLIIPVIIISICIKIERKGSIIYKSKRVGKNGILFDIYKFRTMVNYNELNRNNRVTKVGQVLRKTSLDEIPQLINVLKGDMSLVGPRPWVPEYYKYFTDEQKKRNSVLPGITGLAQVRGRNSIDVFKKIEYDLQYIDNMSVTKDLKIILETIITVLKKENVDITEDGIKKEISMLKSNLKNEEKYV